MDAVRVGDDEVTLQNLVVETLPVELHAVLTVPHPVLLQHEVELGLIQDSAEYPHIVEQDGNERLTLEVVFLEEDEVEVLVVLHPVYHLLGPVPVLVRQGLELVIAYLAGTGQLTQHQTDQTDDVHRVGVDAQQQFFLGEQFEVLLQDQVVLFERQLHHLVARHLSQNLDLVEHQFGTVVGNEQFLEYLHVLDQQGENLQVCELAYENVQFLTDDGQEEVPLYIHDYPLETDQIAQQDVLVFVHDQEHHEHAGTVALVVHGRDLEVVVEFLELLRVVYLVVLLVDQFVDEVQLAAPGHRQVLVHQDDLQHQLQGDHLEELPGYVLQGVTHQVLDQLVHGALETLLL